MTEWITIRGGTYTVGLDAADVAALAATSARAARRRVDDDADAGLDDWAALDRTTANIDYLARLLARALPARTLPVASFRIRRVPVTNGEWHEFMRATGAPRPAGWSIGTDAPDGPVLGVSWHEATRFAAWASASLPEHAGSALPDETQWERAARGPARRLFPWGDDWSERGAWLERQRYYDPWSVGDHAELASSPAQQRAWRVTPPGKQTVPDSASSALLEPAHRLRRAG